MIDYKTFFKGKKITVMGLGLLGRGLGDAKFLAECGAELVVTDTKTQEELRKSVEPLRSFSNITFHLGGHKNEDFKDRDFILKAAGVPFDSPYIEVARENGIPVEMSTSLFARFSPALHIGITGTRGKSTVTHALYEILKHAGKKVFLGGNVRGVATLPLLAEITAGDFVGMELDSWQLQGFGDSGISPHIAIFTTFLADHLNYYKGDMDRYLEDKANIFKFQSAKDKLILSEQVASVIMRKYLDIRSWVSIVGKDSVAGYDINIPGEHNRANIALAVEAAKALDISEEKIKEAVAAFKGVPGRLELIRDFGGICIYNDTTSTTPDSTIAALKAVSKNKNVILIMGGADKTLSMSALVSSLSEYCSELVLLPGTGTDRIKKELAQTGVQITAAATMQEAVRISVEKAKAGDVILMSPAFASFGLFKNEFDRGDQFDAAVKAL